MRLSRLIGTLECSRLQPVIVMMLMSKAREAKTLHLVGINSRFSCTLAPPPPSSTRRHLHITICLAHPPLHHFSECSFLLPCPRSDSMPSTLTFPRKISTRNTVWLTPTCHAKVPKGMYQTMGVSDITKMTLCPTLPPSHKSCSLPCRSIPVPAADTRCLRRV